MDNLTEHLLPKVKSNLILQHDEDDDLLRSTIRAALDYAKEYQHRQRFGASPFATHIVCGACGGWYGKKVWGSYKEDKTYRREIWQCNDKYSRLGKPAKGCKTPTLTEDDIKERFLAVWNGMTENRENLIADCR
ncbi:MAG: head-tail connector protein, partial [Christensenellaceae bacterium]|nr:head-tail connector protein [Christensenellaceae bacterium]